MAASNLELSDVQSWWEIPSITYFSMHLGDSFQIPKFFIEDFEAAILNEANYNMKFGLVTELYVCLLKGCAALKKIKTLINLQNYQKFMKRLIKKNYQMIKNEHDLNDDVDFLALPLRKRLQILHSLCSYCLDTNSARAQLNSLKMSELRVDPLGFDKSNRSYWYFKGTRLYRENTQHQNPDDIDGNPYRDNNWTIVCLTMADWHDLAKQFKNSKNTKERKFYKTLNATFFEKLSQAFQERDGTKSMQLEDTESSTKME